MIGHMFTSVLKFIPNTMLHVFVFNVKLVFVQVVSVEQYLILLYKNHKKNNLYGKKVLVHLVDNTFSFKSNKKGSI